MLDHEPIEQPPVVTGLLMVADVAAVLKVSRSSVYKLFEAGRLGWVQVGAHRRVSASELQRFILDNSEIAVPA